MLAANEADEFNRNAEFLPQTDHETLPCVQVGDVQLYTYIDDEGTVTVSVYSIPPPDPHGRIPLRVFLEDTPVYDTDRDAEFARAIDDLADAVNLFRARADLDTETVIRTAHRLADAADQVREHHALARSGKPAPPPQNPR